MQFQLLSLIVTTNDIRHVTSVLLNEHLIHKVIRLSEEDNVACT